ncbi:MAG: discoidin domain-containing protein, partial [Verrucomicrobiae bacterium]|nr:discoidin domain-containing protein [Verrucomicrobiae bacterium]
DYVNFAADWQCTGVVIWGLQGWHRGPATSARGSEAFCRELVAFAHTRGVKVIHGFGLNGYDEGRHICKSLPSANAVIPEKLRNTSKGKDSVGNIFCPSNPDALKLLREMLLRAADTGIDGFNFETADVDYITCHCATCEQRFQSAAETEHENKPQRWSIEQANWAIEFLAKERPKLWLSIEFAMQRFGRPPYLDSAVIARINREIDGRAAVVWAEGTYPPQPICEKLAQARRNIGFYIRSAEFMGRDGPRKIKTADIIGTMRRLWSLQPQCLMYRSWRPFERWAVNMAVAAEAMRNPLRTDADFVEVERKAEAMAAPGQKYSGVERIVPGNLASPAVARTVTCSSEDTAQHTLVGLTDGVAEPDRGMWLTERNNPKEAWAEIRWPKPQRIARVRVFHQMDGHYRSLDYVIEYWSDGVWRPIENMPVIRNAVHGWREHVFKPLTTDGLRLRITRAMHGNRMGVGELEIYEK